MTLKKKIYVVGAITFLVFVVLASMNIWVHRQVLEASRIRDRVDEKLAKAKKYAAWKNGLIRSISDVVASGHAPLQLNEQITPPDASPNWPGEDLAEAAKNLIVLIAEKERIGLELKTILDDKRKLVNELYYKLEKEIATTLANIQMGQVMGREAPDQSALAPYVLKSLNQLTLIALNALISMNYPENDRGLVERNHRFLDEQLNIIDPEGTIAGLFGQLFDQLTSLETVIPSANKTLDQYESRIASVKKAFDYVASITETEDDVARAEAELNRANEVLEQNSQRSLIIVILLLTAAPVLVIVFGVIGLNRTVINPISHLVAAMRGVVAGSFDVAAPVRRNDEIGRLAGAFNAMAAEIKSKVSDLSRINRTLAESETKYRTLVDNIPQRIFCKNLDLNYVSCNRHFALELGLSETEIIGLNDYDLFPEDLAQKYRDDDARIIRTEATEEIEELFNHDGRESVILTIKTPLLDDRGRVTGVLGIFWDITERKEAEKELRLARFSLDNSSVGILWVDDRGRIQYANDLVLQRLGFTREELIGQPLWEVDPEFSADRYAQHWREISDGRPILLESIHRTKDGQVFPVEVSVRQAKFMGVRLNFAYISDIGPRKKMEAQLRQAQKMESIGRLAGGIAHDFNNMLTIILGAAELALAKLPSDDPLASRLTEIHKAAERSSDLTRQLLAFARRQTIAPKVLNLSDAVEVTLQMVRRLIGEDIELIWRPAENPWAVKIDPSQLDQILANLCVNARDAIAGVGTLSLGTENVILDENDCRELPGFKPGQFVMLTVSDTGCGMDKETLEKLFEPFFTTKGPGRGSGLGLATVYGIVRQNDGFIHVYSEPDRGSVFKIYLPRCLEPAASGPVKEPALPTASGNETILLVEDDPVILDVIRMTLEELGYRVLTAISPAAAIQIGRANAERIDLLMTDVIMPEMNGRRLAETLRTDNRALKCLFMSGYTADVIAHHGVLDEGVQFIQKPFNNRNLAVKIREALDQGND